MPGMFFAALAAVALENPGFELGKQHWSLPVDSWKVEAKGGQEDSSCAVWECRDPKSFSYAKQDVAFGAGASWGEAFLNL